MSYSSQVDLGSFLGTASHISWKFTELQGCEPVPVESADSRGYEIQVWRNIRPLYSRYPCIQQPLPNDGTSMCCNIVVHDDEIRPVLGHNDRNDDILQAVLVFRCAIHKM